MKLGTTLKKIPKLSFLWKLLLVLALVVAVVTIISAFYLANNPPVYFKVINGTVTTSDGNTYSDAKKGKKIPLNVLTQIKTDSQVASIQLWNGSVVIMDSATSIEFNRPKENENELPYAFNLLKGRVLVVNQKIGLIPIRIFMGSDNTVRASQSAMGLEVFSDGKKLNEVDCLFGKCLVNGVHLLLTGQFAQIGPGEIIQVTEGASIADWISLWEAGNLSSELKNLLVNFIPGITPTIIQTKTILSTQQAFLSPVTKTLTQSLTPSLIVVQTMTLSPTSSPSPSSTLTPSRTIYRTRIPTFTKTLSQGNEPSPSRTPTPSRTPVPPATPTLTLIPTYTPSPTDTPVPTDTPLPTATDTPLPPTDTPLPTATIRPTKTPKPPPPTDLPTPTPTDTPLPTPTDTPLPTPTDTPLPTPTDVPV